MQAVIVGVLVFAVLLIKRGARAAMKAGIARFRPSSPRENRGQGRTAVAGGLAEIVRIVRRVCPEAVDWRLVATHAVVETEEGDRSWGKYLFGIKSTNWSGPYVCLVPVEVKERGDDAIAAWHRGIDQAEAAGRVPGNCFRAYDAHDDSVRDYLSLLSYSSNYRPAWKLLTEGPSDPVLYDQTLVRTGYKTALERESRLRSIYADVVRAGGG